MSETTSYLLRHVPRDLWAEIKNIAYREDITIREFILEELNRAVQREEHREKNNKVSEGKSNFT